MFAGKYAISSWWRMPPVILLVLLSCQLRSAVQQVAAHQPPEAGQANLPEDLVSWDDNR